MVEPHNTQMTNDTAHAHCAMDNYAQRITLGIGKIFAFPRQQLLGERASILC